MKQSTSFVRAKDETSAVLVLCRGTCFSCAGGYPAVFASCTRILRIVENEVINAHI